MKSLLLLNMLDKNRICMYKIKCWLSSLTDKSVHGFRDNNSMFTIISTTKLHVTSDWLIKNVPMSMTINLLREWELFNPSLQNNCQSVFNTYPDLNPLIWHFQDLNNAKLLEIWDYQVIFSVIAKHISVAPWVGSQHWSLPMSR